MVSFVYIYIYIFLALVCLNKLREKFGGVLKISQRSCRKVQGDNKPSLLISHISTSQLQANASPPLYILSSFIFYFSFDLSSKFTLTQETVRSKFGGESTISHCVLSCLLVMRLIHCIAHLFSQKKIESFENQKKKHLVASFASLGLSLEAFRLHSCIGRNFVKSTCLELNLTSQLNIVGVKIGHDGINV